jgi:hypothetical protein
MAATQSMLSATQRSPWRARTTRVSSSFPWIARAVVHEHEQELVEGPAGPRLRQGGAGSDGHRLPVPAPVFGARLLQGGVRLRDAAHPRARLVLVTRPCPENAEHQEHEDDGRYHDQDDGQSGHAAGSLGMALERRRAASRAALR